MPKLLYYIKTPLGEFKSSGQAAAAHKVDRSTIMNRCETNPTEYQKIPKPPAVKKVKEYTPVKATTWPLTWAQYKWLDFDTKEEIWQAYCQRNNLNPDTEDSVEQFFNEMDQVPESNDETSPVDV